MVSIKGTPFPKWLKSICGITSWWVLNDSSRVPRKVRNLKPIAVPRNLFPTNTLQGRFFSRRLFLA